MACAEGAQGRGRHRGRRRGHARAVSAGHGDRLCQRRHPLDPFDIQRAASDQCDPARRYPCRRPAPRDQRPQFSGDDHMSVTVRFCGAARTVTGSCYLVQSEVRALAGRLRPVPGAKDPEGTQLRRLSVPARRYRCRASDACPYRPQRAVAEAGARGFSGQDPGDARHHRPLFLHVAGCRQHSGIGGRRAQPAQCGARAIRGQPDLYPGRCRRIAAVVPAGRLRDAGST